MQMSANLVGTVLAAGVIYVIGVLVGAITPNDVLNVAIAVAGVLAGTYSSVWMARRRANGRSREDARDGRS